MKVNIPEIINKVLVARDVAEKEYHIHQKGKIGGSGTINCVALDSLKWAGVKIPKTTGIKAKKGGMWVGKHDHIITQDMLEDVFGYDDELYEHIIKLRKEIRAIHPDLVYASEIYITIIVSSYLTIESPIDIAFLKEPGYIMKSITFKNKSFTVRVPVDNAEWVEIWDIKTCSDYAYYKYLNMHTISEDNPISHTSDKYKAQMHVYMKGTGLKECHILYINKLNFDMFVHTVKWDEEFWNKIVHTLKRKWVISNSIRNNKPISIKFEELAFNGDDLIECRYCPFSETHEELQKSGRIKLILDKPCEIAQDYVRKDAMHIFKEGQKWKRGMSHITINRIDGDIIYSTNKSGKEYVDTIFVAIKTFKKR